MLSFGQPGFALLALPLLVLWGQRFYRVGRGRWLRLLMIGVLALALADPRWPGEADQPSLTVAVDLSASTRGEALKALDEVQDALRAAGWRLRVLGFGRGVRLLADPGTRFEPQGVATDEDGSDLAAALAFAASAGAGEPLLLISDGRYSDADPRLLLPLLREQKLPVFSLPVALEAGASDVWAIADVAHEGYVEPGQPALLSLRVLSQQAGPARLSLLDGAGTRLQDLPVDLQVGENRLAMRWVEHRPGLRAYRLRVEPLREDGLGSDGDNGEPSSLAGPLYAPGDAVPENNEARVAWQFGQPRRVLLLALPGQGAAMAQALRRLGVDVVMPKTSTALERHLSVAGLAQFAAVVLHNMPLDRLPDGADTHLAHYVRELGGGLWTTGGRASYAAGGYFHSELEPLLPVRMDRRRELRRPRVAMAMVLDVSGSMGMPVGHGGSKMDLANRGAIEAARLLTGKDELAVFAVDSKAHSVIALGSIADLGATAVEDKIGAIKAGGGGIFVYEGLSAGIEALIKAQAATRHVVLFADAADAEQPGEYQALVDRWVSLGGTVSVIALGNEQDADAELLREIARRGKGRMYFTEDAMALPRVFAQDAMAVARQSFLKQAVTMRPGVGLLDLPLLASPKSWPSVGGYNLSFLQQRAQLMVAADDDLNSPLIAGWQQGRGRVLSFAFAPFGHFSGGFGQWPQAGAILRAGLTWVLAEQAGEARVGQPWLATVRREGRRVFVEVELSDAADEADRPRRLMVYSAASDKGAGQEGQPYRLDLSYLGPRRLGASFELRDDSLHLALVDGSTVANEQQRPLRLPPVQLPYSPEFDPKVSARDGLAVMAALASGSGGQRFTRVADLPVSEAHGRVYRPLVSWVAALLLLLLLLESAWRRGLLDAWLAPLQGVWRRLALTKTSRVDSPGPSATYRQTELGERVDEPEPASVDPLLAAKKKR